MFYSPAGNYTGPVVLVPGPCGTGGNTQYWDAYHGVQVRECDDKGVWQHSVS
jgi:hypothetical protein